MRVIHVVRKPLSESSVAANVLKHGTGAINVDACRIAGVTKHNLANGIFRHSGTGDEQEQFVMANYKPTFERTDGRWPANLILQHRDGCRKVGTVDAPATSIHGTSTATRRSGVHADAGGHQTVGRTQPVKGYANDDGTETIDAWECERGCPVAALDGDVGVRTSGSNTVKRQTGSDQKGNAGATYGAESRPAGSPQIFYGDTGGVSRFYKQVGGNE